MRCRGGLLLHCHSCPRVRRHRHSCESRNPVAGAGMACFCTGFLPSPSPMRGRGGLLLHWIPAFAGMTGTGGGGRFLHWIPAVTLADAGPGRPAFALDSRFRRNDGYRRGRPVSALDSCPRVRRHRHSCESRNPVAGAGMACFYTGFPPSPSPMRGRGGLLLHWIPAFASAATVIPAKAGIQWPGRGWPAFTLDSRRHPRRCGAGGGLLLHWIPAPASAATVIPAKAGIQWPGRGWPTAVRPTRRTGPTSWGCIVRSAVSSRSASMPSVSSLCG